MIEQLNDIEVIYTESQNSAEGSKEAFEKIEALLPVLKGRRFYGVVFDDGKYWACVKIEEIDEPNKYGLKTFTIPAGLYAKTKLKEWQDNILEIRNIFNRMAIEYKRDESRPCIEFYRSQKELILYLPVQKGERN